MCNRWVVALVATQPFFGLLKEKRPMKKLLIILLLLPLFGWAQHKTENVILITLDGYRWQEVFRGAEQRLISKQFVSDSGAVAGKFWAPSAEQRREKLMPFIWTVIGKQGQLYGNRDYQNFVNVTNRQWFSYPGYSELLCGFADDARINTNDKIPNPNTNILEFIDSQPAYKGKVAVYSSWDVFPYIVNSSRNGIPVNSGIVEAAKPNERERWLNELMHQVPNPLGDVRLDAFTFHYGWEYMKKNHPKVMYFAFDETDDFAHGGKYDLYLDAAHYIDGFLATLWSWCQSDPQYKGKTTFIITCDHGRGSEKVSEWRDHGIDMPNADQIWFAVIGPDTPAAGEVKNAGQLHQNQVAATVGALLGIPYKNTPQLGVPVEAFFGAKTQH